MASFSEMTRKPRAVNLKPTLDIHIISYAKFQGGKTQWVSTNIIMFNVFMTFMSWLIYWKGSFSQECNCTVVVSEVCVVTACEAFVIQKNK